MHQKSRQKTTSSVEKDFFKLLNSSNFGFDCRNNVDNCILEPFYGNLNKISYIKKFTAIFGDDSFRHFFSLVHMRQEIIQTFQGKIFALNQEDPTYEARKEYYQNKMDEKLDAANSFENNKQVKK